MLGSHNIGCRDITSCSLRWQGLSFQKTWTEKCLDFLLDSLNLVCLHHLFLCHIEFLNLIPSLKRVDTHSWLISVPFLSYGSYFLPPTNDYFFSYHIGLLARVVKPLFLIFSFHIIWSMHWQASKGDDNPLPLPSNKDEQQRDIGDQFYLVFTRESIRGSQNSLLKFTKTPKLVGIGNMACSKPSWSMSHN